MNKKEKTVPGTSAATDAEQSSTNYNNSITDWDEEINSPEQSFEEFTKEMRRMSNPSYLKTVSMNELFEIPFNENEPLVEGLLHIGTYLFVGAPKVGKSFLMSQLAYHVGTGTELWGYKTQKAKVLYLALEDNYNRLQKRLYRMFGTESTENLYFSVSAGQINGCLDDQLNRYMRENPDTKLIIIDTLQKIRKVGGERYSYANDYEIITKLKQFADSYKICLLLVHHTRKQNADDLFDTISGTNGLLGAADGAFILSKEKRTSNKATLEISGRDQQEQKIHLIRNENTLCWDFESTETELWKEPPEPMLEEISKHFSEEKRQWIGTPTELAKLLNTDIKPNSLTLKLNVNADRLFKEYRIKYENKRYHTGRKVRLTYLPA